MLGDDKGDLLTVIDESVATHIKTIWEQPGIREVVDHLEGRQFNISALEFLDRIEEIGSADFCPTFEDCLRVRARTTGANVLKLQKNNQNLNIVDVGGQKSERTKWIHYFDGINAILFICAVSEYNQTMFEDEKTNRMHDSLELFESTVNQEWFKDTDLILFLNKRDLFEKKFPETPLKSCFPDWDEGVEDVEKAYAFIEQKFKDAVTDPSKSLVTHVTCATDNGNVEYVFNAIEFLLFNRIVADYGF